MLYLPGCKGFDFEQVEVIDSETPVSTDSADRICQVSIHQCSKERRRGQVCTEFTHQLMVRVIDPDVISDEDN